jgi:hypothetical protein
MRTCAHYAKLEALFTRLSCRNPSPVLFISMFQHFESFREAVPSSREQPSSCYLEDAGLDPSDVFARTRKTRANQCDSFSVMIRKALDASPRQRLYIHEIYQWILDHYPHIREAGNEGWRVMNSPLRMEAFVSSALIFASSV